MLSRTGLFAGVALTASLLLSGVASAQEPGGGGAFGDDQQAGGELLGDGSAGAWAQDGSDLGDPTAPRPGGGSVVCRFFDSGTEEPIDLASLPPELNGQQVLVLRRCEDIETGEYLSIEEVTITPPVGQPDPGDLAVLARSRLPLPLPEARMSPDGDQTVNLATWLWVDNWAEQSRSASAGGVTSVVVATPVEQRWTFGSPSETVVCRDAGTPYDLSRQPWEQSTNCAYTFRHSSSGQPGDAYQVQVTLVWHVTWTSNIGQSGDLGFVSRTATIPTRVAEHQALNESGSSR